MKDPRYRLPLAATLAGVSLFGLVIAASAMPGQSGASGSGSAPAAAPFGPGEKMEYQVRLGVVSVGRGTMEVLGIENVNGFPTYRARFHIVGGLPFARVDTRMETWVDVSGLFSRRFEQDQNEIRFRRQRTFDFFPESRRFTQRGTGETGTLPTDRPLDDLSFIYFARTLPLEVGDTYTIPRYFKEDGNPVVLNVLRRERVTVPAGTFNTIVVQPIIQTDGLFGQGGRAEVYFSDDDRRLLVHMTSRVPLVGAISMNLQSFEEGRRLGGR